MKKCSNCKKFRSYEIKNIKLPEHYMIGECTIKNNENKYITNKIYNLHQAKNCTYYSKINEESIIKFETEIMDLDNLKKICESKGETFNIDFFKYKISTEMIKFLDAMSVDNQILTFNRLIKLIVTYMEYLGLREKINKD